MLLLRELPREEAMLHMSSRLQILLFFFWILLSVLQLRPRRPREDRRRRDRRRGFGYQPRRRGGRPRHHPLPPGQPPQVRVPPSRETPGNKGATEKRLTGVVGKEA